MENIFNKIIENFPNLGKEKPIQIQKIPRTPNRQDQKRNVLHYIIVETLYVLNTKTVY